ncbi:hypothetical protein Dsin_018854 [Dipteronia sinensis]|uniref:Uncharacterized protein n=1 Tax=Dipteronia sinensis TaxID=43782 RepID=A0AAE0E2A2_9ROSI|nr:hypothetical protein Dsin_018854 [Dipteronia sinensis]
MIKQCLGAICGADVVKGFEGTPTYQMNKGGSNVVANGNTKGDGLGTEIVGAALAAVYHQIITRAIPFKARS